MNSCFKPTFSDNVNSLVVSISYNVTSITDEKSTVLQWLSPLEPQKRHQGVSNRRLGGTGHWFLETAEFQKWCKAEDGSLVIDTLCHQFSGKDVGVACLYCDFHAQEEKVTISMMGGILKQLLAALGETLEISGAF
ncbi:hypothetical protein L873DRAFT_433580 [Choiromyces venosus 120613-1]|uniref:Uncharacterized protein n=1 Tax=Choiromyces venosus 120613-1 TaxID=1336337 RepID=A0A3N4J0C6_9PEZI|nr:hypothetical protein L873DRAFT_433580 [Choiromyces venosus 120613-1]